MVIVSLVISFLPVWRAFSLSEKTSSLGRVGRPFLGGGEFGSCEVSALGSFQKIFKK